MINNQLIDTKLKNKIEMANNKETNVYKHITN